MNPEASRIESELRYGQGKDLSTNDSLVNDLLTLEPAEAKHALARLAERWRTSTFVISTSRLVDLYAQFKAPALLESMKVRGTLEQLGVWDQCRLYKAGVADVEPQLLENLWRNWRNSGRPERREIVKALGECGGQEALKVLEAIRPELAGSVPEKSVAAERGNDQALLAGFEVRADESFLDEVRSAVVAIRRRIKADS